MEKGKLFSVSIIILAISIIASAIIISNGLKSASGSLGNSISNSSMSLTGGLASLGSSTSNNNLRNKDTMNAFEAAEYLGINQEILINEIISKKTDIPYVKISGTFVFSESAIEKWMQYKEK